MSRNKRRFAGEQLLAEPHIAAEISSPRYLDKEEAARQRFSSDRREFDLQSRNDFFKQGDRSVTMLAAAEPFGYRMQLDRYPGEMGSQSTMALLREADPKLQYDLSFTVDGSFYGDTASPMSRSEAISLAREVDRRFDKMIPQLQENSVVYNSPVGAMEGDYERADLYMRKGFGPVQVDGGQYGIVRNGRIEPLSPLKPLEGYALHRAERSYRGGDPELGQQMLEGVVRRNPDMQLEDLTQKFNQMQTLTNAATTNTQGQSMPVPVAQAAVDPRETASWQDADADIWSALRQQAAVRGQQPAEPAPRFVPQRRERQAPARQNVGSAWGSSSPAMTSAPAPVSRNVRRQQPQRPQRSSADAAIRAQRRRRLEGTDPTRTGSISYGPINQLDPSAAF